MHDIINLDISALRDEIFEEAKSKKINLQTKHLSKLRQHYNKIIEETNEEMEATKKEFAEKYAQIEEQRQNMTTKEDLDKLNEDINELEDIQYQYNDLEKTQKRAYTILKIADLPSKTFNVVTNQFSKMWATTKKSCAALKNAWKRLMIKKNEKIIKFANSLSEKAQKRIDKINGNVSVGSDNVKQESQISNTDSVSDTSVTPEKVDNEQVTKTEPTEVVTEPESTLITAENINNELSQFNEEVSAEQVTKTEPAEVVTEPVSTLITAENIDNELSHFNKEINDEQATKTEPVEVVAEPKVITSTPEVVIVEEKNNNSVSSTIDQQNNDEKYVQEQLNMIETLRKNNGWSLRYWMKQMGYEVPEQTSVEEVRNSLYNQLLNKHMMKKDAIRQSYEKNKAYLDSLSNSDESQLNNDYSNNFTK